MADIEKIIAKKIGKSIFNHKMIENGDKILIAVSGGKDSLTLLHDLCKRQKSFPIKYEIEAAHIMTDFCDCCGKKRIKEIFESYNIKYHLSQVPVLARLKPGKKMNCYWCSTQRRMELLRLAEENGCNKIALGHHLDDIVETFLMNICYKSEVATMLPVMKYEKFNQVVIRPLASVKESEVIKFATEAGFRNVVCECKYGKKSKRLDVRKAIKELEKGTKNIRENIYRSMTNINVDYMITK